MPCYHPRTAYRSKTGPLPSGKWPIVFQASSGLTDDNSVLKIPCGQCIGCRLEHSRQWAIRCVHEAQQFQNNSFITLTYDEEHIQQKCKKYSKGYSLNKREFVLFMKRLRKHYGKNVRFFHCGEYGEERGRPHHHACLFNIDISDKKLFSVRNGVKLYTSETIAKIWGNGFATIGDVTFESAAYCARYVVKKITGKMALAHYGGLQPEYQTMSRGGRGGKGIGFSWLEEFGSDVYPNDGVIIRGLKVRPPRYYDNIYDKINPEKMGHIKLERTKKINKNEQTASRLKVREKVTQLKMKSWVRDFKGERK